MSSKYILWATTIVFAVMWSTAAALTKDQNKRNHCITRSSICTAASFVILALPD